MPKAIRSLTAHRFTLRRRHTPALRANARGAGHSLIAVLILAALTFLFFWRLFALRGRDRMWLPAGDLTLQYFPLRVVAAREIAAGHLPLWNLHMYAGQPALADSQMAALYPINLLTALVLGLLHQPFTFFVFQLQIVAHYSLAAIFTYAFAYRLTRNRFAAWVAALTFTFGGYLISYPAQQPTILASAVWLPLVLLGLDWAAEQFTTEDVIASPTGAKQSHFREKGIASACVVRLAMTEWHKGIIGLALAGAAMAMSILAGHPQTWLYVFYTALAYWLFQISKFKTQIGIWLLGFGIFCFFAFGLSAVQLLPTLEFTRLSTRAQLGYAFTSTGFALHEIITVLIPGYFGGSPLYVGVIPLLLAGAAFIGRWTEDGRRRSTSVHRPPSTVSFWLVLALVALFLSLGDSSFVYSLFYLLAPGFALVRDQERAALLWSFALAMLAAIGATQLGRTAEDEDPTRIAVHRPPSAVIFRWLLLALIALIAFAYVGALASEGAQVNLFPGALRQLVPSFFYVLGAWALWRVRAPRFVTLSTPRLVALGTLGLIALNLFSVNGAYNFQKPTPPSYFPETTLTRALKAELQANPLARVASEGLLPGAHNAGAEYDFEDINGNDPLHLDATEKFDQNVQELRKFQLLGVHYLVTQRTITHGAFSLIASEGDAHLYRYNGARPRAWLVHAARVVPPEKNFETLNDDAFDPASTVLLNAEPPISLADAAPADAQSEIVEHHAGFLKVRTHASANHLLVVSEIFYPGWQVTVDGQPAPLLRANDILMAVPVPSGDHQIELTFAPDLVKIGALISALSLLLWIGVMVVRFRRVSCARWKGLGTCSNGSCVFVSQR